MNISIAFFNFIFSKLKLDFMCAKVSNILNKILLTIFRIRVNLCIIHTKLMIKTEIQIIILGDTENGRLGNPRMNQTWHKKVFLTKLDEL